MFPHNYGHFLVGNILSHSAKSLSNIVVSYLTWVIRVETFENGL